MKKTILLSIAALALVSCAKEMRTPGTNSRNQRQVTIIASMDDEASDPDSRTTVDGVGVYSWQGSEKISLVEEDYDSNGGIDFTLADAETGAFSGTLTAGKAPVFAVSPKGILGDAAEDSGVMMYDITLPNSYSNYVPGTTNAVMIGAPNGKSGDNYKFIFRQAAALLKFTYVNVPVGTKKFVYSNTNSYVTGTWSGLDAATGVSLSENDANFAEDGATVTLDLATKVYEANTTLDFYIPVPVSTYKDFAIELQDKDGNLIAGTNKSKGSLTIPLAAGDIFPAPSISLSPVVKGSNWTYTFTSKDELVTTGCTVNGLTITSSVNADAWEDPNGTGTQRGAQFPQGSSPVITIPYNGYVENISAVLSTNGDATVGFKVDGHYIQSNGNDTQVIASGTANKNKTYEVIVSDNHYRKGDVSIELTSSASKRVYLQSVTINDKAPANLSYAVPSYNVIASASFDTPELINPNSLSPITFTSSDSDVASVNSSTGEVTVKTKNGTTTITASFAGNSTHKAGTATYTITVSAPFITLPLATTPTKADCADNSVVSFDVSSNLAWTASKGTDANSIIKSVSREGNTVTVTFNANSDESDKVAEVDINPVNDTYSACATSMTVTQRGDRIEDVITYSMIAPTSSPGYQSFNSRSYSGAGHSEAVYAGIICYQATDDKIQFNADNSTGIVTTASGGSIKRVAITWFSGSAGYTIDVYGKNTSYNGASDLYDENAGTKLGSLVKGTNDYIEIDGYYEYIGLRPSTSGARYLSSITTTWGATKADPGIMWKKSGSESSSDTATLATGDDTMPTTAIYNPNGLSISYSSSDESVAAIHSSTGAITLVGGGSTDITATFSGDATYRPTTKKYTLTVTDSRSKCATPSFSPGAGAVIADTDVTISSTTPGATIYYTVDGTDPNTGSAHGTVGAASATVTIDAAKTVKAIAVKEDWKDSDSNSATYTIAGATYSITIAPYANGTVTTSPSGSISPGETVTITATPNVGYALFSLSVKDALDANVPVNGSNQFTMPNSNVTVTAVFAQKAVLSKTTFTSAGINLTTTATTEEATATIDGISIAYNGVSHSQKNYPQVPGASTDSQKPKGGQLIHLKKSGVGTLRNTSALTLKKIVLELTGTNSNSASAYAPTVQYKATGDADFSNAVLPSPIASTRELEPASGSTPITVNTFVYEIDMTGKNYFKIVTGGNQVNVYSITIYY